MTCDGPRLPGADLSLTVARWVVWTASGCTRRCRRTCFSPPSYRGKATPNGWTPTWSSTRIIPSFFEHPLDHIPAMMLVEAGRQLGIAVSHMFLDVPFGTMFATDAFDIRFTDFAEVHLPVRIAARTSEKRFRRNRLAKMRMDGHFFQRGRQFGSMAGEWSMLVPRGSGPASGACNSETCADVRVLVTRRRGLRRARRRAQAPGSGQTHRRCVPSMHSVRTSARARGDGRGRPSRPGGARHSSRALPRRGRGPAPGRSDQRRCRRM